MTINFPGQKDHLQNERFETVRYKWAVKVRKLFQPGPTTRFKVKKFPLEHLITDLILSGKDFEVWILWEGCELLESQRILERRSVVDFCGSSAGIVKNILKRRR